MTVPPANTLRGISGNGTAMTLQNVAVEMQEPTSTATAVYVSQASATLDHLSVGGPWKGAALDAGGSVTLRDSNLSGGATGAPVANLGTTPTDHLTTIVRSRLQQTAGNTSPVLNASDTDILIDCLLLLGSGNIVSLTNSTGAGRTITVVSSTLDAGALGVSDGGMTRAVYGSASGVGSRTDTAVRGSVLLEPLANATSAGAAASGTCRDSDTPDQTQTADATHGAIDCSHAAGNATSAPANLFAAPGSDYNLKPGSSAVDAVPEPAAAGAVSSADLAGNPRVLDGNLDCNAVRDRGALELTGRANTPPHRRDLRTRQGVRRRPRHVHRFGHRPGPGLVPELRVALLRRGRRRRGRRGARLRDTRDPGGNPDGDRHPRVRGNREPPGRGRGDRPHPGVDAAQDLPGRRRSQRREAATPRSRRHRLPLHADQGVDDDHHDPAQGQAGATARPGP